MDVSASADGRPRWILPRPAFVELALALMRLAIAGLLAIALSGGVAAVFGVGFRTNVRFGRSFRYVLPRV